MIRYRNNTHFYQPTVLTLMTIKLIIILDKIILTSGGYLIDLIENNIDNGTQYVDRKDKEFLERCHQILGETKDDLENIVNDHNDNIVLKNKEYQNNLN